MAKVGRPTKYTPELLEKCHIYLEKWQEIGAQHKDQIPSHIALADYLGITTTCLYEWNNHEDKKEFSDILEEINKLQQRVLLNNGLSGEFNSNITKLVLGKHGFHDKQESTVKNEITLTDMSQEELDRRIKHLESLREKNLSE